MKTEIIIPASEPRLPRGSAFDAAPLFSLLAGWRRRLDSLDIAANENHAGFEAYGLHERADELDTCISQIEAVVGGPASKENDSSSATPSRAAGPFDSKA